MTEPPWIDTPKALPNFDIASLAATQAKLAELQALIASLTAQIQMPISSNSLLGKF